MEPLRRQTLAEIINRNYRAALIFDKFSLDYCNGDIKLENACKAQKVVINLVLGELQRLLGEDTDQQLNSCALPSLIEHICNKHHVYVQENTPVIKSYLNQLVRLHGDSHPEVAEIANVFYELAEELMLHMKKEEVMFFPFIERLCRAAYTKTDMTLPVFKSVKITIDWMKADHARQSEKLQMLSSLTNNYTPPADVCIKYSVTYQMLKDFEQDLNTHMDVENNILFPKAMVVEEELNSALEGRTLYQNI
jgi:regulator of cell morphogenesis and NO signaling